MDATDDDSENNSVFDMLEDSVTEPSEGSQLFGPSTDCGASCVYTKNELQIASIMRSLLFHKEMMQYPENTTLIRYNLEEGTRLGTAAELEQEPLTRMMLFLQSVLCFLLTGRVMEIEQDAKGAFMIYRQTVEYIKLIHSMPQRYCAAQDKFNKLNILSLRVQALLYLRMFNMYNREVKEYTEIVTKYQQKPASAESTALLSPTPTPSPAVSVLSFMSAPLGYCSLVQSAPAHAHKALQLLTKYYAFQYVADDLWKQAERLCQLPCNQDLFKAVDTRCGPLSLTSTFRHLAEYVRYAVTLLKSTPR